ncbi:MAG: cyclopropane fatty acyl phospholipid synthase [Desulfobacterales bacterium]
MSANTVLKDRIDYRSQRKSSSRGWFLRKNLRKDFETLLSMADIKIGGKRPWDIHVNDDRFYARVLRDKNLGLGEAYMDGLWDCPQIDECIYRILKAELDKNVKGGIKYLLLFLPEIIFNRQSKSRSHNNVTRHYDIGNDLFMSFLDPYNQYSCAYFNDTDDLYQAQQNKLDLICKKTAIGPDDHVLDIGCGWGGFAKYAAEHYGCKVTAVNISKEQLRYAGDFCKNLPVHLLDCDYRNIRGSFDKIVSVGMFEHVGEKNYNVFMQTVHRCLKDDGIFLLHTIGNNESQKSIDPWITKYIFPNSMLPSMAQITKAVEGLFVVEDWHNLGPHYDKTLMAWNENFRNAWPDLKDKYDERFKRMWEYYLVSCAAAFRARSIHVWQIVLTKCGRTQPECRI